MLKGQPIDHLLLGVAQVAAIMMWWRLVGVEETARMLFSAMFHAMAILLIYLGLMIVKLGGIPTPPA